jgi:DNA-binding transcriptional regulator YdaS (Cro superfamily)
MEKTVYQKVVDFFGNEASLARSLGMTPQGVYLWKGVIPQGRAYQIESITGGEIKAAEILSGRVPKAG